MSNWIKSFFEESPGVASSTRLNAIAITATTLTLWAIMCITTKSFVHLTYPEVAALGLGLGAKLGNDIVNK